MDDLLKDIQQKLKKVSTNYSQMTYSLVADCWPILHSYTKHTKQELAQYTQK